MSTETINTTTEVKQEVKNGIFYNQITTIREHFSKMNPLAKKALICYGSIMLCCYASYNYSDGVNALKKIREKNPNSNYEDEWKAIRNGINSYENFWDAMWFPFSITSKIMPAIIMTIHKK
jgi:hypothetical protein